MATATASRTTHLSEYAQLLKAPARPQLVTVPAVKVLAIDGRGAPEKSREFQDAIGALFSMSYTARFAFKNRSFFREYHVTPLEGLWWSTKRDAKWEELAYDEWRWTLFIAQPDFLNDSLCEEIIEALEKRNRLTPAVKRVRFEVFNEGRAVQMMHVGPYAAEAPTIKAIHEFIEAEGMQATGKHHEIYLGDPRRAKPENLKTILRQPVK